MALQELALKKIRDLSELSNLSGYIPLDSSATGTRKFDASKLALAADVNTAVSSLRRDVNSNVASIAALRSRLVAVENKVAGALSYIGEASIEEIEAMRIIDIENGSMYTMTEDGTINYTLNGQAKTLEVEQYDEIAWGEKGWNIIGKDRRTDLSEYSKTSEFATVAFSGDYNDLEHKPTIPEVPVKEVTVGGQSVVNAQGTAEIPEIPTVPVKDVAIDGQSVVDERGIANIPPTPEVPVQDVTVGGSSVLNASGVAEIPQIPTVPVQDVTYGGQSVLNGQGVAEIPEAPEVPVQDVTYRGESIVNEEGVAAIPDPPEVPVQDVTVGGTSVLNAQGVAEIPQIPTVPVQDVTANGQSIVNEQGVAEIPDAPVQDVTVGGQSVLNAQGVAEIPQIPTVPVQDVTYGGNSLVNAQGVAEIPEAPEVPVQDVTYGGQSVLNEQGVAEIPEAPEAPVQDVTYGGASVLNAQGVAEIPEAPVAPVQDVTVGGTSVLNASGVAEIPQIPTVPVQDVTYGGSSVLNAQGVAEIPEAPAVPVQDVTVGGTSVLSNQGVAEIPSIPDAQIQSDWNQQDNTKKDFIKNKPSMVGRVHFLKAVGDELSDAQAPYGYWIVDLDKPNPESPYGYDYAMAEDIMAKLSAGEVFVLSTYSTAPSPEEDLFIMDRAQNQSRDGHPAVRIWFTRMFASGSPEYMYFTTIYTPSMYNGENNPLTGGQPEGRMAILNWRGDQSVLSEFRIMPYTSLASVATTGDYNDLINKPTIPTVPVQDVTVGGTSVLNAQGVAEIPQIPNVPVQDVTVGGTSVLNAQGVAEIPAAPSVPVQDVTVGGTSVLNAQGVAEIPAFPSPGLTAVAHDTTLNGNGTAGSPLSVRMEAVITQVTEDIEEAVDAVKSRIVYTVGLSSVDNTYNHNGSYDTNGVFAKGTLFNPPMDFDLTDETRIVFSTNQSAGGNASKLYFAIYQYDAASKSVNWVANTDNCISFVQSSGYQAGFHFARLSHMKDGLTKFSSGKLYYLVMFTDDTNFRIAGNTYSANMNTFNGGTNLGLGAYLNSVKDTGGATAVITDGSDIESLIPKINWEGEYLTRIFVAITNVTEAPFIDLGNSVLPTNVDLAGSLPNFTPAAKNCVFMRVTPSSNCDVVAIEWIDSMSTLADWAERNSIYTDDYSTWLGSGNTITSTTTAVGASLPDAYRHELRFATPISLVANTNYKIECECFDSASSKVFSWSDPADYIEAFPLNNPPATPYNHIIGKYLKITCVKDGVETSYVI